MTDKAKPRKTRRTTRKSAPAARTTNARTSSPNEQSQAFYESVRQALVEDRDPRFLGQLARENLTGSPTGPRDEDQAWADRLFDATRLGAEELLSQDRQAAADLFTDYIAEVVPLLRARGLDVPDVRAELRRQRLVSRMAVETLSALVTDDDAPADARAQRAPSMPPAQVQPEPPEPDPVVEFAEDVAMVGIAAADAEPAPADEAPPEPVEAQDPEVPDDHEAEEPEADDEPAAVKSIDEIIEQCLSAEQQRRRVVLLVGLATTGKSFLVRRLKYSTRRDYTVAESKALAPQGAQGVSRTKDVLLYTFSRNPGTSSAEDFDLYDIPGDWFGKLLKDGFRNPDENRFFSLVYTIFAFADAIVFLAPAYHVLMPEAFVKDGDDDPDLKSHDRRERRDQMDMFIHSLDPMTIAVALLRKEVEKRMPRRPLLGDARKRARREAARAAVDMVGALNLREIMDQRRSAGRLGIPGALLLSRADEFARRLPRDHVDMFDTFDEDPARMMLSLGVGKEYFSHLSSRFAAFTTDFLTAQENRTFTRTFRNERPSAGVTSFFRGWLLPAISSCRRPVWARFLESPRVALWLRRHLDPSFAREWNRP
ncbi:MAG: hypothetical protein J0L52_09240 [Caulobacterales bacterium]|nr:hypothetical protein [Caulobacterales bacterium]